MFGLNPNWILDFRSEPLTELFKTIPFFASHYFYFPVIALGYWLRPKASSFIYLGFLIPFSIIFNTILKNIFQSNRPPLALHLLPIGESLGYPSADVQVATVFWLILGTQVQKSWRPLFLLPILIIAISRVYLGVHSVEDVIAGFLFGFATILIWNFIISLQPSRELLIFFIDNTKNFLFGLIITVGILITSPNVKFIPTLPLAIGVLGGWFWSLPRILYRLEIKDYSSSKIEQLIGCLSGLVLLFILEWLFRPFTRSAVILSMSLMIQFFVLTKTLYAVIPDLLTIRLYKKIISQ